ncbi:MULTISPECIES: Imm1 family immunity protein [Actinosynnema]|uniref:Imm1 family immunity protein n=1 Tax=Actinosynnema TaxID=40566 RepID=UPI0020A3678B|nr:Imm1 family immunity protein [Actinosynnema pretiosum]MCP2099631.1 Immunity protein Imm1 [Actinosynnema pretiosum]
MALTAIYDRETGRSPVEIRTRAELDALVDRVRGLHVGSSPVVVEFSVTGDEWSYPILYAGIGRERGFVQEHGHPVRATLGDPTAKGEVVYDLTTHATSVPADQEVPLEAVREVLAAYLAGGGVIPPDHPRMQLVAASKDL